MSNVPRQSFRIWLEYLSEWHIEENLPSGDSIDGTLIYETPALAYICPRVDLGPDDDAKVISGPQRLLSSILKGGGDSLPLRISGCAHYIVLDRTSPGYGVELGEKAGCAGWPNSDSLLATIQFVETYGGISELVTLRVPLSVIIEAFEGFRIQVVNCLHSRNVPDEKVKKNFSDSWESLINRLRDLYSNQKDKNLAERAAVHTTGLSSEALREIVQARQFWAGKFLKITEIDNAEFLMVNGSLGSLLVRLAPHENRNIAECFSAFLESGYGSCPLGTKGQHRIFLIVTGKTPKFHGFEGDRSQIVFFDRTYRPTWSSAEVYVHLMGCYDNSIHELCTFLVDKDVIRNVGR